MSRPLTPAIAIFLAWAAPAISAQPSTLYNFRGAPDGADPSGVTYANHQLFGTTILGGTGTGTLYQLDPTTGAESVLYSFPPSSLLPPTSDLLVEGNTIYGTTYYGGTGGLGTLYRYDLDSGTQTTLYNFAGNSETVYDGAEPDSGVISVNGIIYGTCEGGGVNDTYGTLFSYDPKTGKETTLYKFYTPNDRYIGNPVGPLVNIQGTLYGVAIFGGQYQFGGVFSYNIATGRLVTLYSFNDTTDLFAPYTGLTYANGLLYGVLAYGGTDFQGVVYSIDPRSGIERIVHQFSGGIAGGLPDGRPTFAAGKLFGNLNLGGANDQGGVYQITLSTGAEKLVSSFPASPGPSRPAGSLAVVGRTLVGTSASGGTSNAGTVFRLK